MNDDEIFGVRNALGMSVANILLAVAHQNPFVIQEASVVADQTSGKENALAVALHQHLVTVDRTSDQPEKVYESPEGFQAFIDNGGNPRLYAKTIENVRRVHFNAAPKRVLDIGCGDGRVTAATLGPDTKQVTLVEPSAALLAQATERIYAHYQGIGPESEPDVVAKSEPISTVIDTVMSAHMAPFDLVQSTFALHTLGRTHREEVLAKLAKRTRRLAVVEFDVPEACSVENDRSRGHAEYAAEKYAEGVAEYAAHPQVITDFLMPVLWAQFAPGRVRQTFEQPASAWAADLAQAGFDDVSVTPVDAYWWANAVMLTANGRPAASAPASVS